ncbi:MAG: FtsX-like permease family protein, partial [bacterium]|nr:FtsX-like permease family protein [bacterium]
EDLRVFEEFLTPIPERLKKPLDIIKQALRKKYGEDAFFLFTNLGSLRDELKDQIEDSEKLLGITFLFSLLLSGIILTSMMLMSVHKRVSEIGVRRAFGARKKDIFLQFLSEGIMIYSVGIIIGLMVGILIAYLVVNKILHWEFFIPIYGIIISSIFIFLVGILSSLYP